MFLISNMTLLLLTIGKNSLNFLNKLNSESE